MSDPADAASANDAKPVDTSKELETARAEAAAAKAELAKRDAAAKDAKSKADAKAREAAALKALEDGKAKDLYEQAAKERDAATARLEEMEQASRARIDAQIAKLPEAARARIDLVKADLSLAKLTEVVDLEAGAPASKDGETPPPPAFTPGRVPKPDENKNTLSQEATEKLAMLGRGSSVFLNDAKMLKQNADGSASKFTVPIAQMIQKFRDAAEPVSRLVDGRHRSQRKD